MKKSTTIIKAIVVGLLLIWGQNSKLLAQNTKTALPGNILDQFDFFYAGESKVQDMYIVKNGSVA
ncbi:hypothetical protein [uncultured Draconibacterium sp.]|uniref:hypothetical protein n=1 Tax=uncultured Draconibacterium sp. TaxID=1573823 RepID=UPI003217268D